MVKIIAEFCQNHNGSFETLGRMLDAAAEGGATHGKIQTIFADDLSHRPEFDDGLVENGVTKIIKRPYRPEYERLKGLELSFEQQAWFVDKCKERGLEPLTTCFTRQHVKTIRQLGFRHIKVASYDCGSLPLIRDLAETYDQLIVSTGATYDHEIEKTSQLLRHKGTPFAFLHCVTLYPTPLNEMHLERMKFLKQYTPAVGLSEHSLYARDGVKACLAAIHQGAEWIERHFTVLPADQSKDGPVSIDRRGLEEISRFSKLSRSDQAQYIKEHVPEAAIMAGHQTREMSAQEILNRDYFRGRFASRVAGRVVYNWEDTPLHD